jgi:hypothetical protein
MEVIEVAVKNRPRPRPRKSEDVDDIAFFDIPRWRDFGNDVGRYYKRSNRGGIISIRCLGCLTP